MAGEASPKSLPFKSLTSPLDRIASCSLETRQRISTHSATAPFGRSLAIWKTGDQINDFLLGLVPSAVLLALPKARDAADVFHARPIVLDAGGVCWKHVDRTLFDAPVRLFNSALKRDEGEKPAR